MAAVILFQEYRLAKRPEASTVRKVLQGSSRVRGLAVKRIAGSRISREKAAARTGGSSSCLIITPSCRASRDKSRAARV